MILLADLRTIHSIADRAVTLYVRLGYLAEKDTRFARVAIADEILTVHRDIAPLRLVEFLESDDVNFAHDIGGIHRHLEYGTSTHAARLKDCFLPRFAS